jgi:hypothetical protein
MRNMKDMSNFINKLFVRKQINEVMRFVNVFFN